MKETIELLAAQTILERGIRAKVRAPFFLRIFRIRSITLVLRPLYAGTLIRVAAEYFKTGISLDELEKNSNEDALSILSVHGKAVSMAVAVALLNSRWKIRLFAGWMSGYLMDNMRWKEMLQMLHVALIHNGTADFINTTRLVRTVMITEPKDPGQKKKGS